MKESERSQFQKRPEQKQNNPSWKSVRPDASTRTVLEWMGSFPESQTILSPADYFRKFFDEDIMSHIVYHSNLYAIQSNPPSNPLLLSDLEFKQFLGTVLKMSVISMPCSRLYWSTQLGINQISSVMARSRFEQIKAFVYFNDNANMAPPGSDNFNQLFKIRPLLSHLQQKYNAIPMDQMVCIDEQMIPFKGSLSLKQYVPSKPHKYGYKVFVICNSKGINYDFQVYMGNT